MDMEIDVVAFPELGVAPQIASGTDLEDELPTPADSPVSGVVRSAVTEEPQVRPVLKGGFDLELAKALLYLSVMPMMIAPIVDPIVSPVVSPAAYPVPPIPVELADEQVPLLAAPPVRDSLVRECSPLPLASPGGVNVQPTPSSLSPSIRLADVPDPLPAHMATMDQYLPRKQATLEGESLDSPGLLRPMTPQPIVEVVVVESAVDSTPRESCAACPPGGPNLSREGPFDVYHTPPPPPPVSGISPWVLDSLPGCQYRMTSYDEKNARSDVDPAYGIHLHDPWLLEYVGAPESARLLSRTPEYWLQHMGREETLVAALQLQHDAGLIMSNIQVTIRDVAQPDGIGGHARGI